MGRKKEIQTMARLLGQVYSQMRSDCYIPAPIPILQDPDGAVLRSVVLVLGKVGESAKSAIPALILRLKDQEGDVRSRAAYALGQTGESVKSAIPDIIPLLKDQSER